MMSITARSETPRSSSGGRGVAGVVESGVPDSGRLAQCPPASVVADVVERPAGFIGEDPAAVVPLVARPHLHRELLGTVGAQQARKFCWHAKSCGGRRRISFPSARGWCGSCPGTSRGGVAR